MMSSSAADNLLIDEINKRRLLIDGDGGGDDRKLTLLIKAFSSWCTAEESMEDSKIGMKRLLNQVHQSKFSSERTLHSIHMNESVKEMYKDLRTDVQSEIEETKNQIADSKIILEKAMKHRKYSMEYDALAKLIESKPDRRETEKKKTSMQQELDTLKKRKANLEARLEGRKRNMVILVSAMERLKDLIKEDEEDERSGGEAFKERAESPMDVDPKEVKPSSSIEVGKPISIIITEASSPMEQILTTDNGTTATAGDLKSVSIPPSPASGLKTGKNDKYEDLSESEGEEH